MLKPKDVPYQASLLHAKRNFFFCGGSFLSQKIVISAAHCIQEGMEIDDYLVSGGGHYYEEDSTHFDVTKIFKHEKYDSYTHNNDIAILILEKIAQFPKSISFVTLPKKNEEPKVREKLFITGYGKSELSNKNVELRGAVVPIYDHTKCKKNLEYRVTPQMICAGFEEGGIDTCQGNFFTS